MHGRPPAGPSIAISFLLVAIACSFCRPLLRRTRIDISHRRQCLHVLVRHARRNFAWIIGLGSHPRIRSLERRSPRLDLPVIQKRSWRYSASTCRKICQSSLGRRPVTGAYFNLPGFLIVFILTLLLCASEGIGRD